MNTAEELGEAVAEGMFKDFGPNGDPKYRGPNFKYPETLISMVAQFTELHADLEGIKDKKIALDAGHTRILQLIEKAGK